MNDKYKELMDIIGYWSNPRSMEDWGGFDERDLKKLKALRDHIVDAGKANSEIPDALAELIFDTDRHLRSYESAVVKEISLRSGVSALTDCWDEYSN